mgnify:CR=1 FL=1
MGIRRFVHFATVALLCAWTFSVLIVGADMLAVWAGELRGEGLPQVVYVPMSQRLALLAVFAVAPPLALWVLWRTGLRIASAAQAGYRSVRAS